jgi:lipoprotein-anchoring transpeptidase ErfK/SrfK
VPAICFSLKPAKTVMLATSAQPHRDDSKSGESGPIKSNQDVVVTLRDRLFTELSVRSMTQVKARFEIAGSFAAILLVLSAAAVAPAAARETVAAAGYAPGTIVIHTHERRLYYYLGGGKALRYPVGVGRAGQQWSGTAFVNGKYLNPAWTPPSDIRRNNPDLPTVIPGGSPQNPMGVAALTLSGGEYAIHGTNRPESIGGFVSHGCIRMYNEDITDLFRRVDYHTPVVVTN